MLNMINHIKRINQIVNFALTIHMCAADSNCLFCFLKDKTSDIIVENKYCYVLYDRMPASNCHLLVVSKEHAVRLDQTSEEMLCEMIKMAKMLANKLEMTRYQLINNNEYDQYIKHIHFHLCRADEGGNYHTKKRIDLMDAEHKAKIEEVRKLLK